MKKVLVLGLVLMGMIGCSAGKDGAAGTPGANGKDGVAGTNGTQGLTGADGTNNKIVSKIYCSGTFITGILDGNFVDYTLVRMASGDLFVTSNLKSGQFSNSGSNFYSANSVGANSGYVSINVDNVSYLTVEFTNSQLEAKYISSTPGNSMTYVIPSSNCTIYNY